MQYQPSPITFGSVCSGIEAASAAWRPLGWRCAFVSEIDRAPRAVLAHHYPDVPLHHDFTTIEAGDYGPIDVLVGGTPCQSFSVAGLRGGLADERGNLALEYLRLAERLQPRWLVWENVPGVLSSAAGRDFGAFIGGLAELGYGWAYRILDAQYFGLAQRRQRVFVVGCAGGDWRRAAAVLFEPESLRRHPAPRRGARQNAAGTLAASAGRSRGAGIDPGGLAYVGDLTGTLSARTTAGGGLGTDFDCAGGLVAFGGNRTSGPLDSAAALLSQPGAGWKGDFETETFVVAGTLNANGKAAGSATQQDAECGLLVAHTVRPPSNGATWRGDGADNLVVAHTLRAEGHDASEDGTGRGTPLVVDLQNARLGGDVVGTLDTTRPSRGGGAAVLAFNLEHGLAAHGAVTGSDVVPSLTTSEHKGHTAVLAFDTTQITHSANRSQPQPGDPCHPLAAGAYPPAIAFQTSYGSATEFLPQSSRVYSDAEASPALQATGTRDGNRAPQIQSGSAVRRLLPAECEALQGFPRDYTLIPYGRGLMPDSQRYRMLGNSMAVPVVAWIGRRIAAQHADMLARSVA